MGTAWIKRDGAKAIERLLTLPDPWKYGAIYGATTAFENTSAGLALLNWLEKASVAAPPDTRSEMSAALYDREIYLTLSRLAHLDLDSAKAWLTEKPERYAKTTDDNNISAIRWEMFKRDPLAAFEELRKLRPEEDATWSFFSELIEKNERLALEWLDAHPKDPQIEIAYSAAVSHWQEIKPGQAAQIIARMRAGKKRTESAASLYKLWSGADPKAAKKSLDTVIGVGNRERTGIENEIQRLKKNQ